MLITGSGDLTKDGVQNKETSSVMRVAKDRRQANGRVRGEMPPNDVLLI